MRTTGRKKEGKGESSLKEWKEEGANNLQEAGS